MQRERISAGRSVTAKRLQSGDMGRCAVHEPLHGVQPFSSSGGEATGEGVAMLRSGNSSSMIW